MSKKPDLEKIEKIRNELKKCPEGLWIREIARRVNLPKSTVSYYINTYMKNEVENVWEREFIRVVRLKK